MRTDSWTGWVTVPPGEEPQVGVFGRVLVERKKEYTQRWERVDDAPIDELRIQLQLNPPVGDVDVSSGEWLEVQHHAEAESSDQFRRFVVLDPNGNRLGAGEIEPRPWHRKR